MRFCAPDAGGFSDEAFHGIRFCVPDAAPMPMPLPFWDNAEAVIRRGIVLNTITSSFGHLFLLLAELRMESGSADADVDFSEGIS